MRAGQQPISPSGRYCFVVLCIPQYEPAYIATTDDKHLEDYHFMFDKSDELIFLYRALPGACVYSRIKTNSADIIRDFEDDQKTQKQEVDYYHEWIEKYILQYTGTMGELPLTLQREEWEHCLSTFTFKLIKKKNTI